MCLGPPQDSGKSALVHPVKAASRTNVYNIRILNSLLRQVTVIHLVKNRHI